MEKEKDDIRPVAEGSRKEPGLDRKLKDVFISDNAGSVGDYLVWDVVVPGIKNMLQQAGHGLVDGIFGNGGRSSTSRYSYSRSSHYSESRSSRPSYSYSRNEREYERRDHDSRKRRSVDSEVVLPSWADAEAVRDGMMELLERYGRVTVSDMNALAGLSDRDFTDTEWGWEDISSARIRTVPRYYEDGDGYALELPPPVYVK